MSVIVKGVKMPESCGTCFVGNRTICKNGCPLGVLPDKHGDLIDRDEAYDCIAEQEGGNYVDMDTVGKGLECAPTIVEAEGD